MKDTVKYAVRPESQNAGGSWNAGKPLELSVNGINFVEPEAENPMRVYDFWMENPDAYGCYYLIDLDTSDSFMKIALVDCGSSDFITTTFFRYNGGKLITVGWLPSDPSDMQMHFYGDGTVDSYTSLKLLQTWSGLCTYRLQDNEMVMVPKLIEPSQYNSKVTLMVPLTMFTEQDIYSKTVIATPESGAVTFPLTDNLHWVQASCADGTIGWIYFPDNGYSLMNGKATQDVIEVFNGLSFAG